MKKLIVPALALAALAGPATAPAKPGHGDVDATVALSSRPPADLGPNEPWRVQIAVQDERGGPVRGVNPIVHVLGRDGVDYTWVGLRTGKPGVYDAEVFFPRAGVWQVDVEDGLGGVHRQEPVSVAAGGPSGGTDGDFPALPAALAGLLLAGGALALVLRRRRARPATAGA